MTFSEFIVKYWQYIGIAFLAVLDVVIMIIKKRPKKWDELHQVLEAAIIKLPGLIMSAETMGSDYSGGDKKHFVLSWAFEFIETALKRDLTPSEEQYAFKTLSHYVEQILETPTKKGGLGREQEEDDETI